MHKLTDIQITLLGNHVRQQGVRGNIKRYAQEQIGASLVKLAGELAVGHVELEKAVTGCQRHATLANVILGTDGLIRKLSGVPGGHDQPAGIRFGANLLDHFADLVNHLAIGALPASPLFAIDRPKVTILQCPLVPDRDLPFLQPGVVGGAPQEPEQFVNDAAQVDFLGSDQRKALLEVEANLTAKHRPGADTGAVSLVESVINNVLHKVEIGFHRACLR